VAVYWADGRATFVTSPEVVEVIDWFAVAVPEPTRPHGIFHDRVQEVPFQIVSPWVESAGVRATVWPFSRLASEIVASLVAELANGVTS
jgi:hypothetical protein